MEPTKTRESSLKTRLALANALRELLAEEKFDKITISKVAERAGMNRKTFYYHFRSTGALLAWMIENETIVAFTNVDLASDLTEVVNFSLDYLEKNRELFRAINSALGRGPVHKFLYKNMYPALLTAIEGADLKETLAPGFRDFVAEFYAEAIVGVLQNWLENPIPRDRNEITEYIFTLAEGARSHLRGSSNNDPASS